MDAPPSTRNSVIGIPASSAMASRTSFVWKAIDSRQARAMSRVGRPTGNAEDGAAGVLIPIGRPQSSECRDHIDAAVVPDRVGERFNLLRAGDAPKPIPQPLHHSPTDEDASLQSVRHLVAQLPGNRGEQVVLGVFGLCTRVHHDEAAGAVSVLDHALPGAHLAEHGGLLVARYPGDGNPCRGKCGRRHAHHLAGTLDSGEHRYRDVKQRAQFLVPFLFVDIEKQRPAGIGHVGRVNPAVGQLPDQPGIDGAESQLARLRRGRAPGTWSRIQRTLVAEK